VPEFLGKVIDKALAKEPEARFQRAGEMARTLRSFLAKVDQAAASRPKGSRTPSHRVEP
jgi:hypothetical protein